MSLVTADRPDVSTANHLPPIIDLGRALASNDIEYDRLDALVGRRTVAEDRAMSLLLVRRESLWQLIGSMPAKTLADAAVQISVACHFAESLECSDWSGPDTNSRLQELASGVARVCLSVLPLVAEIAGLDLAEMDWTDFARLRASRFYGAEDAGTTDHPDAELLALAAEVRRLRTEAEQLQDSIEHLPMGDPQSVAAWDMINGMVRQGHEKTAALAIMPSRTMEGLKAKAALAFGYLDTELDGSPPFGEALEWSVCRDLLAGSAS